ncbi:MAG: DEAD/DEAH box helicase family protein [Thermoplasmata archaeon]
MEEIPINKKLTRFGYIFKKGILDENVLDNIRRELTVRPYVPKNFAKLMKVRSFKLYDENGEYMSVPRFYGLKKLGKPDVNQLEDYNYLKQNMSYIGKLRPVQKKIVENVLKGLEEHRGGLLIAGCGTGKTNMAIYIACKYKLKTLIIVHKTFLKNQVVNRIQKTTNVKNVGIIQRKKVDIDHPFVVGMLQSLTKIDYDDEIFKDFGMIIIDEVHHMGARNFSKIFRKVSAKYMLGISAEHRRNDGMFKIINWYMGPILHEEGERNNQMVVVKKFHYITSNLKRVRVITNRYTKEPDKSVMITNLIHIKKRNQFIINLIRELYNMGKYILCLSGRLKQIDLLYQILNSEESISGNVGKYIGKMSEQELAKSATKRIILGTFDMAQEGLDIENLNVVILCTPKTSIRQSIGRILRKEVYEEYPIVVDIVDDDNDVFRKQSMIRNIYYRRRKYNIQNFYVSDYSKVGDLRWKQYNDIIFIRKALISSKINRSLVSEEDMEYPNRTFIGPIDYDKLEFLDDE